MATGPKVFYEFGPFRVDPDKQVLLRENQPVAITPKAFETLLILVRHSREVVSKDDLMKGVWPDAFVEEANLSQNIFTLRKALGDTLEDRRYIVTHPGKGYCLAVEVRTVRDGNDDLVIASRIRARVVVEETDQASSQALQASPNREPSKTGWKYLWIATVCGLLVLGGVLAFRMRQPVALGEKDSVLIADFTNTTGDAVFDGALRQGLQVQLEQSPFVNLVAEQRIQQVLTLMGRTPVARLTPELAQEVCERTASTAVLEGSISNLGTQYVVGLRAKDCRTGNVLDDEQIQAARKEDVLASLTQIAARFRTRIGESLATVEKHNTPLEEATTSSLEALKAYSTGSKTNLSTGSAAAVPFFERAIAIDPKFAMAHAILGLVYSNIGESVLSRERTTRAYQLRDRISDRERFFIEAMYYRQVTGNLERAKQTLELWTQTYPRDVNAHGVLGGFSTHGTGKYEQSIEESKKAIALEQDHAYANVNLVSANFYLDRLDEAEKDLQRAAERKIEVPELLFYRYWISFLKGDRSGMEREVELSRKVPGAEDLVTHSEGMVMAQSGQLQQARKKSRQAMGLAQQMGQSEKAATYQAGAAVWQAFFGNISEARRDATAALNISKGRDVQYAAALALALSGDVKHSQALANDMEIRFPEDTCVRFNYMPTLRAAIALRRDEPRYAVEMLQTAATYEEAVPSIDYVFYFGGLYPVYMRGEAYLTARQGPEAAAEFQKILEHRGIVGGDPIGALARLQLGRAYVLSGDKAKARSAYQDFLAIWKEADRDIPVFKEAQREYAELQRASEN